MGKGTDGRHEIQYRSDAGVWKIGHHGIDLKDPEHYVTALQKNGRAARVVDKETGQIFGQPGCGMCGEPHEGVDGSCLL